MEHQSISGHEQFVACLSMADGSTWGIAAGDEKASAIVARLADVMQLWPHRAPSYRLFILTDDNSVSIGLPFIDHGIQISAKRPFLPHGEDDTFTFIVSPARNNDILANQLVQLSLVIARRSQDRGGFLLHGALTEKDGKGVILAGPGGVGKTTASRRLPSSWRSLSDDATLVVRDEKGVYWAHPWPTWSRLMSGGPGGTWDVNHAVPLKAILFLNQAKRDWVKPVAAGQSVCLLVELTEHTSWSMSHTLGEDEARVIRLQRFENICALAQVIPCYHLQVSLNGAFWEEIDRVVTEQDTGAL